jgi:hypothetical protein
MFLGAKRAFKYRCDDCDFNCIKKYDYTRHLSTRKHIKIHQDIQTMAPEGNTPYSCYCGNLYKHQSGLYRHRKYCSKKSNPENERITDDKYELLSNTILLLVKENQDFKKLIIDQNAKMMDMADKIGNNNVNNNNVNSNNKFNLNVFLNEQCKDAMSLKDFVKTLEISMDEFINTGELGFVEGLSQVMIAKINDMDLYNRPIHCTDLKRETVYIKDTDKWEKDTNREHLRKAVKGVAYKNEQMRPVWYHETPDVDVLGSDNCEKFFKYSTAALGGYGKEETKTFEEKIMRNVLKEVTIDKHLKIE